MAAPQPVLQRGVVKQASVTSKYNYFSVRLATLLFMAIVGFVENFVGVDNCFFFGDWTRVYHILNSFWR